MKISLIDHNEVAIKQREHLGCIPTGYEWMIRFAKIENVNLTNFQEEFNLQERGLGDNSFKPIGDAIQKKYPQIKIKTESFDDGQEKIEFIKSLIEKQNPCLISMPAFCNADFQGYHIMPITGFDDDMKNFYSYNPIDEISYDKILGLHSNYSGGHDISWIPLNKI